MTRTLGIVEQVARIINPGAFGAFSEWDSTSEPSELDKARTAYFQSEALCRAVGILELACRTADLKRQLIDYELQGWRELGVPIDDPTLRGVVEKKYEPSRPSTERRRSRSNVADRS